MAQPLTETRVQRVLDFSRGALLALYRLPYEDQADDSGKSECWLFTRGHEGGRRRG